MLDHSSKFDSSMSNGVSVYGERTRERKKSRRGFACPQSAHSTYYYYYYYTFDAGVAGAQIWLEFQARFGRLERQVGYGDVAHAPSGAAVVSQVQHVRVAADVAHVELGAPALLHPAVDGRLHLDHFVVWTARAESLALTVVLGACTSHHPSR